MIGAARREDIVSALRRGTVPGSGLDALAVGIESFAPTLDAELATVAADTAGAFRGIIDGWFYALEQDVLADASVDPNDAGALLSRTDALMEARLSTISKTARLHVDFSTDRRFDNPRAVQIRLAPFDQTALLAVGRRVRALYGCPTNCRCLWEPTVWRRVRMAHRPGPGPSRAPEPTER
jgi:hypothetical protein